MNSLQALELSCASCGDYFTMAEQKERISYFNFNVLKKMDQLRRRSRGFTVKRYSSGLIHPAVLCIDESDEKPTIWIDTYKVRTETAAEQYWEHGKRILKAIKQGKAVDTEPIFGKDTTIYKLECSRKE